MHDLTGSLFSIDSRFHLCLREGIMQVSFPSIVVLMSVVTLVAIQGLTFSFWYWLFVQRYKCSMSFELPQQSRKCSDKCAGVLQP